MPLGDYLAALEMRDIIQKLVKDEVEKQRPRYQMATVVSIDRVNRKCVVTFPGDTTNATVNMGSIQPSAAGQIVRVEGLLGDRFIADVMGKPYQFLDTATTISGATTLSGTTTASGPLGVTGPLTVDGASDFNGTVNIDGTTTFTGPGDVTIADQDGLAGIGWHRTLYAMRAMSFGLTCSGERIVTSTGIRWTSRIIAIAMGLDPNIVTNGYFEIVVPPDGTVITGVGGATSKTVAAGVIPMNAWDALYYIPLYASGGTASSVPGNFRVVNYTGTFTVPNTWIPICIKNGDTSFYRWFDGLTDSGWITVALNAGFTAAGGYPISVRRLNDWVTMRGYVTGNYGTYGSYVDAMTLPVNFRPTTPCGYGVTANTAVIFSISVQATGVVQLFTSASSGAWIGLDNIVFPVN